jgi:thymidylate synthase
MNEDYVVDKTGCKMIELPGVSFIADEEAIFGTVNYDYVRREIDWYLSQSLNVNDIPEGPPTIWKQVADSEGFINSNYGNLIWSDVNHRQYDNCKWELERNPESRRAVMIYQRPSMWKEYNVNGRSDFCCTNAVQYIYRDGMLHAIVQMRSNDVVFGYKNDRAWQDYVLTRLAADLKMPKGHIIWNAGSLHVYERHFNLVK